jgi:hypothetical protein
MRNIAFFRGRFRGNTDKTLVDAELASFQLDRSAQRCQYDSYLIECGSDLETPSLP